MIFVTVGTHEQQFSKEARIIITHGGPGSIMLPFIYKKTPIVIPRQSKFDEHVDDHQVKFAKYLEKEKKIISVYDISKLKEVIKNYNYYSKHIEKSNLNNNHNFMTQFNQQIKALMDN